VRTEVGFGDLDEELMVIGQLRASPPGLADSDPMRRKVFGSSLHQFDELLRAAAGAGPASAPLLLFYALSQAGRAVAAARCEDERWDYKGHGLQVVEDAEDFWSTVIKPNPRADRRDAFSVLCDASGSSGLSAPVRLGPLWASIPETESLDELSQQCAEAIELQPMDAIGISARLDVPEAAALPRTEWDGALKAKLSEYGQASRFDIRGPVHEADGQVVGFHLTFLAADGTSYRFIGDVGEALWNDDIWFLRPPVNDAQDLPSAFMSWWALLLALSHYARYVPAAWFALLARDSSHLAIPIERALRYARRTMPRQVLHAITGRWDL
jgi:hypothetical protein